PEPHLAHLDRRPAGTAALARPRQGRLLILRLQYPKPADVLLGLGVRRVGHQHRAIRLPPQRLGRLRRRQAAGQLPRPAGDHLAVQCVDGFNRLRRLGRRVVVVRQVKGKQVLGHRDLSSPLHPSDVRVRGNRPRRIRPRKKRGHATHSAFAVYWLPWPPTFGRSTARSSSTATATTPAPASSTPSPPTATAKRSPAW